MLSFLIVLPMMNNAMVILVSTILSLVVIYMLHLILALNTMIKGTRRNTHATGIISSLSLIAFTMNTSSFDYFINQLT